MATIRDNRRPERGLRPVQDIVGRIRFDPIFDAAHFTIGYEERFAGVREAPLADFLGEGEVPWHRIWFIKAGPLIVWDRRERIDLVFGSGISQAADLAAIQRACAAVPAPAPEPARQARGCAEFVPIPCLRFDPGTGAWRPVDAPHRELALESLAVLTYNVLYDLHEAEHIYSDERRLACRALLQAQDADIIALQEVTPEFWTELLADPWVQAGYHVSAGPEALGLQPYGQALLSRWPLALRAAQLLGPEEAAARPARARRSPAHDRRAAPDQQPEGRRRRQAGRAARRAVRSPRSPPRRRAGPR